MKAGKIIGLVLILAAFAAGMVIGKNKAVAPGPLVASGSGVPARAGCGCPGSARQAATVIASVARSSSSTISGPDCCKTRPAATAATTKAIEPQSRTRP